jgi:hypothetical protein
MDVNVLSAYLPNWLNVLSFPFMGADFSGGAQLCITNSPGRRSQMTQNTSNDKVGIKITRN